MSFRMSGASRGLAWAGLIAGTVMVMTGAARAQLVPGGNIDFGDQRVGVLSDTHTVTVTNNSAGPVTLTSCEVTNRPPFNSVNDPLNFLLQSTCTGTIAASASFDVDVAFQPLGVGAVGAKILITYDDGGTTTAEFNLDGTGIDGPDLIVNDDWSGVSLSAQVGSSSAELPVPMENASATYDLTISGYTLSDSNGGVDCGQFSFDIPSSIAAATTTSFGVTFTPASTGTKSCTVQFQSDDPDLPDKITVSGSATDFSITLSPSGTHAFGDQGVSDGGIDLSVTIGNGGTVGDLHVTGVSLSGGVQCNHFQLSGVPGLPFDLAPGGSQGITATFDPQATGDFACDLDVTATGATTATLHLTGTGIAPNLLFLAEGSPLAFGSQQIGPLAGATAAKTVSIVNQASADDDLRLTDASAFDVTTDPDCSQFEFSFPGTPILLAPGEQTSFDVAFNPSSVGFKACDIYVYSNDPDSPSSFRVQGTGTAATINLTPDPKNWGNVVRNATVNSSLTVTNVAGSSANLILSGLTLGGTNPGQFAIVSPTTFPIALNPGQSQTVTVSCHPTSTGPKSATLTVASNADIVTNNDAALNCTGVKPDAVVTPPPAYTFGDQQINTTSTTTRTFTVTAANNTYSSPLTVLVTEQSGNTGQFGLTSTNSACLTGGGCTLDPGQSADFTVTFRPTTIGTKSEVVRITTDDQDGADAQIDYTFTGNGINPEIETTTASPYDFGDVLIGSPENGTITIRNAGTTDLRISSVILTGGNAGDFAIMAGSTGSSTITPSATADWTVRCNPTVEGARTTTFRVASNDYNEANFNVTLNCHGTKPNLVVTPNPIAFPPTFDCTQSDELTVTLENQGSAPLAITSISSGSSTFSITTPPAGGYPVNLAADESTTIGITFIPPGVNSYNADLTIAWDDGPTVVSMTGDGRLADVAVTESSWDFGDVRIDQAAIPHSFYVENTGTDSFDIDLIELDNTTDFTLVEVDAVGATVVPGGKWYFEIDALPGAVGSATGTVAVTTSLPSACASVLNIPLDATGVAPGISVNPSSGALDFGGYDIQLTAPEVQTVTITNSGTAVLAVSGLALTGDSQFSLAAGQETDFDVPVGGSVDVDIEYRATMVENNSASLDGTSDAVGGSPIHIQLTGHGIDRDIDLSVTSLAFPETYRNTENPATLDFDISNLGAATLHITTVDEGGAGASAFSLAADVPPTIDGGGKVTVTVEFKPTAAGLFEAYLELTNDDTDEGVARIDLSGMGRVPNIATPALPVDLGRIGIGVPTRLADIGHDPIALVNRESDSFTVRELKLVDASSGDEVDPSEFRILDFSPGSELAAGATMDLDVEVVAQHEGEYEVTMEVYLDSDPLRVAVVTIRAQAVPATLRGGGCQVGGGGVGTGLLLLLGVGLLLALRRRRRASAALVLVLVVGAAGGVARADLTRNLDLTTFRPMPGVTSTMMSVEVPEVGAPGAWFLGLFLDHAVNPLNLGAAGTDQTDAIVSGRTAADLAFSYALAGRYEVGLLVPVLSQSGDPSTVIAGVDPASGTSLGDLSLHGKAFLLRAAPISLGGSATVTLPTAGDGEFAGSNGPTAHLRGIAALTGSRVGIAVNGGLRLRGKSELADIQQGNELTYGFAASYQALDRLAAIGELYGAFSVSGGDTTGVSPLEAALGVRYRLNRQLGVVVGAGRGLMAGIGVADVRGFLQLVYSSQAPEIPHFEPGGGEAPVDRGDDDGDGIINSEDRCPEQAEDVDDFEDSDGCPDPDNDGDGLLDGDDPCPAEAEDKDGFKDDDGCPDLDNDDDGVPDTEDKCPDEPEDKDGFEDRDGCDDPDNDKDGIPDVIDQCALEPETINGNNDDDGCPDAGDSLVMVMPDRIEVFEPVRFRGNSARITRKSERVLAQVAATLRANRDFLRVRIGVHVQPRGASDLTLTKRRAEAVRKWLIDWGVEPERLEIKGYGSSRLLVPKRSKGARNINDRVEFILLEKRVGKKPNPDDELK